eukprot:CAMPEP_0170532610 /NCGR_PEP_ID=MMETSP0209-20121228/73797_1 /TAXON_ID=665100 ORGANISM="Litonotus pictus, Strain P1" /NCGR_SAMPLE_ID=MMETSP0209 /ASSEMBLY_ACC=CAM_ASM_000301 /LENGTH=146 /DNA_ID=CAMNT_0010828985 /DNA_START=99 /DNA_END=536 /DNA_ORIENTATION=+
MGACVNRETGYEMEEEYTEPDIDTMNQRIQRMKNRVKKIEIKAREKEEKRKPMKVMAQPEEKKIVAPKKPKKFQEEDFIKIKEGLEPKKTEKTEEEPEVIELPEEQIADKSDVSQDKVVEKVKKRPTISRKPQADKVILRYTNNED